MNRTTVDSNKENKKNMSTVAGSVMRVTKNTLEIPPKGQVYEVITSYIEEQGNMEIPAGYATVNENGQMQIEDGTIIAVLNPQAVKDLLSYKKQRQEKGKKINASSKAGNEIGE